MIPKNVEITGIGSCYHKRMTIHSIGWAGRRLLWHSLRARSVDPVDAVTGHEFAELGIRAQWSIAPAEPKFIGQDHGRRFDHLLDQL